ncbi:ATP-binding protein [Streptomyces himalayensis]|uniref:ATP-binding protein n=1 Tax=Streptomyces himalayensis subsp. himalayensis TaxID=2756131 RepID=A0A7W0DRG6_9ACTN|nr:ATP-binding protein [Streptomyces himalayensis]MBA2949904.1 ATP-binding protein [Streptomyces himalayensis subsp. himalayensis]
MTTEIPSSEDTDAQRAAIYQEFTMCFTSTPRGARLARRLAAQRLDAWGWPYGTGVNDTATLIVAELTANAVQHGRVPGRDFRLRLTAPSGAVRIEVTDARGDRDRLPVGEHLAPDPLADGGRGLWLVAQSTVRWGVEPRTGAPGKTVWAEVAV